MSKRSKVLSSIKLPEVKTADAVQASTSTPLGIQCEKISNNTNYAALWHSIHLISFLAQSPHEKKAFVKYMNALAGRDGSPYAYMLCKDCHSHMNAHMDANPLPDPEMVIKDSTGRDIVMFRWGWQFHNAVNKRLGKPHVDWETAYNFYTNPSACTCHTTCGGGGH